jgi:hypothetical protein
MIRYSKNWHQISPEAQQTESSGNVRWKYPAFLTTEVKPRTLVNRQGWDKCPVPGLVPLKVLPTIRILRENKELAFYSRFSVLDHIQKISTGFLGRPTNDQKRPVVTVLTGRLKLPEFFIDGPIALNAKPGTVALFATIPKQDSSYRVTSGYHRCACACPA